LALDKKNYIDLNRNKHNRSVTVIGGAISAPKSRVPRRGAAVVIATPGRLLDLTERRAIDLSAVEILVLDEADRMLDMGFLPAIRRVLSLLPVKKQTLLLSATMSAEIEKLARTTMTDPKLVEVSVRGRAASSVEQMAYQVAADSKTALLLDLLERERFERVLVFARTRRGAERLAHILLARDHQVNRIHSDRSQPQREAALRGFRDGKTRILVATDIAARGIDVDSVSHVINYDVPAVPEDYVHRIGRTGRAGNSGKAITIVTPVVETAMRAIERLTGQSVKRVTPAGFGERSWPRCHQRLLSHSAAHLEALQVFVHFVHVALVDRDKGQERIWSVPSRALPELRKSCKIRSALRGGVGKPDLLISPGLEVFALPYCVRFAH
jgi:ATP-dependent RNA helicase RhlE